MAQLAAYFDFLPTLLIASFTDALEAGVHIANGHNVTPFRHNLDGVPKPNTDPAIIRNPLVVADHVPEAK